MKNVLLVLTTFFSIVAASSSFACYNDGYYSLCPGDRIVSSDNYTGRVLGINPSHDTVVVDLDAFANNYTYDISAIYVTRGCVINLCVGDRVVSSDNYRGRVIGINPYSDSVVLDLDSFASHYAYNIVDVFSGFGCVGEVCVGDNIVSQDNYPGRVIGINPYTGRVSVNLNSFEAHYSYFFEDLFLTTVCVDYDTGYREHVRRRGIVRFDSYNSKLIERRIF